MLQVALYVAVLVALVKPLGHLHGRGLRRPTHVPVAGPAAHRATDLQGRGRRRAAARPAGSATRPRLLLFNLVGFVVVYVLQRLQGVLPLNPAGLPGVSPDSSFNTAVSFATNTNWQGYAGEATMSYLTQMLGLAVQNFVSAASGMAVLVALIRGFARRQAQTIGNFWVDLTRSTLYILLPLSLAARGRADVAGRRADVRAVPERSSSSRSPSRCRSRTTRASRCSTRPATPSRSRRSHRADVAARPGREPDRDQAARHERRRLLQRELRASVRESDAALELPRDALDPADPGGALLHVRTHGRRHAPGLGRARRDARDLRAARRSATSRPSRRGNPQLAALGVDQAASATQAGGNMEGKETRFGIANSALWAVATTAASNGSVNAMHDSFTPLGGLIPMWLMQLGEVVFGGVGSGLYGMLMFAIVAVFIAGLMVGRTPEYLGKKIEAFEIKMASLAILVPPCRRAGRHRDRERHARRRRAASRIPAVHGFSEILYAFSSAGNNNGSAFAGLSANTPFYNSALGVAMWLSRYWLMIPVLAIAGSLAAKTRDGRHRRHVADAHAAVRGVARRRRADGRRAHVRARRSRSGPIVEHLQMIGRG